MKNFILIGLLSLGFSGFSQNVFFEDFEGEADASTNGTDQFGTNWTSNCTYCGGSGDFNEVNTVSGNNVFEGNDTNGPAEWITDDIDISSCTSGVTISLDLSHVSTLEGIQATCAGGCNTTDLVKLEVSYDSGSSWFAYSDAGNGTTSTADLACDCGTCGSPDLNYPVPWCGAVVTGPAITVDDFSDFTFSDCISVGVSNTVMLRITTMTWAGAEKIRFDNVTLACSNCALPVELINFKAERTETTTNLKWSTLSESENKKFSIERSSDGVIFEKIGSVKGKINSYTNIDYEFTDENPLNKSVAYYRIRQTDLNGNSKFSEIKSVNYRAANIYYDGISLNINFDQKSSKDYHLNVFDLSGKVVYNEIVNDGEVIEWSKHGFYVLEIPEINYREKIVIP